ncbi:MAG: aldo/keto reductase [Tannerellaceae bacterium]|nr:aldo/keto reductase [Tannerellaceae bacterium]
MKQTIHSHVSRRNFLKGTAAMATTLCIPPALGNNSPTATPATPGSHRHAGTLPTRVLGTGTAALQVSILGLGMMGMNYHRGYHPGRQAMIDLARQAAEKGVTFFDTALGYGPYTNEELTGEALAPFKSQVAIGTKFYDAESTPSTLETNIRSYVEDSLKRLNIECIDLYYLHRYTSDAPIEEIAGIFQKLITEGKIKHYGLSEVSATIIRRAHAVQPVTAIQSEYHLMWREPEKEVLPTCQELGIGFVPYSPVNRGFLTGAINEYTRFDSGNDNRNILPRFTPEAIRANTRIVEALNVFGRTRGMTIAQVAQAWLLAKGDNIVPIPGTTKLSHLEENLRTTDFTLSPGDIRELEAAVSGIPVTGGRYPASEQQRIRQ